MIFITPFTLFTFPYCATLCLYIFSCCISESTIISFSFGILVVFFMTRALLYISVWIDYPDKNFICCSKTSSSKVPKWARGRLHTSSTSAFRIGSTRNHIHQFVSFLVQPNRLLVLLDLNIHWDCRYGFIISMSNEQTVTGKSFFCGLLCQKGSVSNHFQHWVGTNHADRNRTRLVSMLDSLSIFPFLPLLHHGFNRLLVWKYTAMYYIRVQEIGCGERAATIRPNATTTPH